MTPEVIETIQRVARRLAPKFVFGYHDVKDIEQEAFIIGAEGYSRYDGKRSLYNFLYTHIKNRLVNYKRRHYERIQPPCEKCPLEAYLKDTKSCAVYEMMEDCSLYYGWLRRNADKKGIMRPSDIAVEEGPTVDGQESDADEIAEMIEGRLSTAGRKLWLRLKAGDRLGRRERQILQDEIKNVSE